MSRRSTANKVAILGCRNQRHWGYMSLILTVNTTASYDTHFPGKVKREDKGGEIWSKYFIPYMKTEI
jgi:hypothetical protein